MSLPCASTAQIRLNPEAPVAQGYLAVTHGLVQTICAPGSSGGGCHAVAADDADVRHGVPRSIVSTTMANRISCSNNYLGDML